MSLFFSEGVQSHRPTPAGARWRQVSFALAAAVTIASMGFVFVEIDRQLERSGSTDSDNVTWTMAQVEVDALKLQRAVHNVVDRPGDPALLENVRLAFDIFYSRFMILSRSDQLAQLPIQQELRNDLWRQGGVFDRFTPLIDGPDDALMQATPAMAAELDLLVEVVRRHVVESLQELMQSSDQMRGDLRWSLQIFAATGVGLLGMMLALSSVIMLQNRTVVRRSEATERAIHNLRATIESSLDAVMIADAQGRITDCNRAAETLFQLSGDTARKTRLSDLVRREGAPGPLRNLSETARFADDWVDAKDGRMTMCARRPRGADFPVEVALAKALGAGGQPMFIAFIRDISERIEREENLRKARNEALQGQEAKSRFLAVMSHEMRTPLNGLIAATELLQSSTTMDERQEWLAGIVLSCGWAALDQVNNVLELTRLGSEEMGNYPMSVFSPVAVIRDLVLQNQPQADKRDNSLTFDEPGGQVPFVRGPRQLFLRVLYNLVGNAIKFTDGGDITLRLAVVPGEVAGTLRLTVTVADTGIGIAEADRDRIFHNFETLDSGYARMREGTGLGLGIAKLSAEAMHGQITVESTLGKGSTFTFEATLHAASGRGEAPLPTLAPAPEMRSLSILIAEDNPINRQLLAEMLTLRGHRVTSTTDGQQAVDHMSADFDLVLMDISMPRMDGLEATRRIRAMGLQVPIIGVTANASPDKVPDFLAAGMTDVLVKPITGSALHALIQTHVAAELPASPPPIIVPSVPVLNDDVLAESVEDMGRDFVRNIVARVLREVDGVVVALRDQGLDLRSAADMSHRTAGAAAAVGLSGLHAALVAHETAAVAGHAQGAADALRRVEQLVPVTSVALRCQGLDAGEFQGLRPERH